MSNISKRLSEITFAGILLVPILVFSQYGQAKVKSEFQPKDRPVAKANLKTMIPKDVKVDVLDFQDYYWLVRYDTITGWVPSRYLWKTDVMYAKLREVEEAKETAKEVDRQVRIREKYDEPNAGRIIRHRVWTGMTTEMLLESKGHPDEKNTTTLTNGISEQWIYGKKITNRMYVYLKNGIVTTIQN